MRERGWKVRDIAAQGEVAVTLTPTTPGPRLKYCAAALLPTKFWRLGAIFERNDR
jgi:hypothetical protein